MKRGGGGECFGVDSESVDVKSGVNSSLYTTQSNGVSAEICHHLNGEVQR